MKGPPWREGDEGKYMGANSTLLQAGHPQWLGCVQGDPHTLVLQEGHARHGVHVGLQGQLGEGLPAHQLETIQVSIVDTTSILD